MASGKKRVKLEAYVRPETRNKLKHYARVTKSLGKVIDDLANNEGGITT